MSLDIAYAKTSKPGALELKRCLEAVTDENIELVLSQTADINWGRSGNVTNPIWHWGCLNSDISGSTDKLQMRLNFIQHNVPAPTLFDDPLDAYAYIAQGGSVIARTRTHTRHKGFWHCNTRAELDTAVMGGAVQYMQYIEAVREYRVHIFRGLSIRLNEKHWTNSEHTDYTTVPADKNLHADEVQATREAAKQAIAASGLDFGAVDVLADQDGRVYVCEVNAAPGLGGTTGDAYARAIQKWWKE